MMRTSHLSNEMTRNHLNLTLQFSLAYQLDHIISFSSFLCFKLTASISSIEKIVMASQACTKQDIENLTNRVLENRVSIIQTLYNEHTEIDPALLYSNYRSQLEPLLNEFPAVTDKANDDLMSVDDFSSHFLAFDEVDKKLPDPPKTIDFKEPKGLRRYNSKTDIVDKTMTSSMTNLAMIKKPTFLAPPPPPPLPSEPEPLIQLTTEDLIEFNQMKQQFKSQLDAYRSNNYDEDSYGFTETARKASDSFDRLQKFFGEFIPLFRNDSQAENRAEKGDSSSVWDTLDTEWIQALRNISEVN